MKQWQWVKLGEVAEIKNGSTPSTLESDNFNGNIVWITPKDLSEQKTKYIYTSRKKITQKGYESCSTTLLPINTICLTSRAPIGLISVSKVELCTNQGFKNIIPNNKELYFEYLYYYLKYRTKDLITLGVGTKFKELTTPILKQYQIPMPPLEEQEKIARILSTIDDLIECNTRINKELESLISRLYQMYFMQFDFPDTHNRPYQSSGGEMHYHPLLKRAIPKDWKVIKIKDLCNIKSGYAFSPKKHFDKKGNYKLITITNVKDGYIDIQKGDKISLIPPKMPSFCKLKIGDILMSLTGNIGRIGMVWSEDLLLNQRVGVVQEKDLSYKAFLYCSFRNEEMRTKIKALAGGTSQDNLSPILTEEIPILKPTEDVLDSFNFYAIKLLNIILKNQAQNHHLASLRDFLLPLLMNAEIEVGEKKTKG